MSREIDLSKPLSDEDRQYLVDRARHNDIARADGTGEWAPPDDSVAGAGEQSPDATDAATGQSAQNPDGAGTPDPAEDERSAAEQGVEPTQQAGDGEHPQHDGSDEDGDNYDDEEAWSYKEIQEEVKDRDSEDKPALNSARDVLVAWLREDDSRA